MAEAEAVLPWMACGPDGKPVADLSVAYVFADVPAEVSEDVRRYRELTAQRRELERMLSDLGSSTVKRLRAMAGLTDDDSAALLGISRQRANQLRNA